MVTSDTIAVPQSPEEAYQVYRDAASAVFLAGAQGLKYKKDHYGLIVDLSKAGLRYIRDAGDEVARPSPAAPYAGVFGISRIPTRRKRRLAESSP